MTILQKDWQYFIQVGSSAPAVTLASVSTATYEVNSPYVGDAAPIVQSYPVESAQFGTQGIRIATAAEVDDLKQHLYGGIPEPTRTTYFTQLLYSGSTGEPLKLYSVSSYIATWYGDRGLGFYVFWGYDPNNPPRQTISVELIQ